MPIRITTTVRKHIVVNGQTYDDPAAMPPDAREIYEQALRAASSSDPAEKKNELKVTFRLNGPHVRFKTGAGDAQHPAAFPADGPADAAAPGLLSLVKPIEPSGFGLSLRFAYGAAVGIAVVLAWWWLSVH